MTYEEAQNKGCTTEYCNPDDPCSECIENIMEEQHAWDYDNAQDNELVNG